MKLQDKRVEMEHVISNLKLKDYGVMINKKQLEKKVNNLNENMKALKETKALPFDDGMNLLKTNSAILQPIQAIDSKILMNVSSTKNSEEQEQRARSLVQKLKKEKDEREKKKQEKSKVMDQKYWKSYQEMMQKKIKEEEDKEQERLKKHDEIRTKIQQKREERVMRKIEGNHNIKQVVKQKPLYMHLEEQYKEKIELPERQRIQTELQNRKILYRPFMRGELDEHSRQVQDTLDEMEHLLRKERRQYQSETNANSDRYKSKLKSKYLDNVIREEMENKDLYEKSKGLKLKMKEKKENYAKYVMEIHRPEVSLRKQEELEHLKQNLKHPVRQGKPLYLQNGNRA
mmetsp:Transcript_16428/g.15743  ORF Transcript_16428/g.15743 Transcript_16428/m.15743 type:complete len:344 (+) Transcript_16428:186-1217(+)|eukprot:CAMPEP_0170543960 /NCGR_PEP_ID=MMETSP0211-20121228/2902_1 /TAXON_ID=311385 /ORGANISM="Pseudokeronopsis sp., Strain OXSARD2" /LENGTH=343 /DNA_ID=CAMNT_0010847493 /DNA_START=126 /DNA_END=1157 /DNA_ORIENTATION=-